MINRNHAQCDLAFQNSETFYFYFPVRYQLPKSIVITKSKSFWVTMERAPRELRWKVGSSLIAPCTNLIWLLSPGDVSLSAEDKPPPFVANRPIPSEAATVDHLYPDVGEDDDFEEYDVQEEHHNWLEGHAAIKFLAAGGIAGAGE